MVLVGGARPLVVAARQADVRLGVVELLLDAEHLGRRGLGVALEAEQAPGAIATDEAQVSGRGRALWYATI